LTEENRTTMHDIIEQLERKRAAARLGGGAEAHRRPARQGQADRARAARAAARRRHLRRMGHVRRAPLRDFGMADNKIPATASSPATA
jgi:hypothetical protein